MSTTFADLGVPASMTSALHRQGIAEPFAIQIATVPDGIAGRDVLARAQTGSGKTLAFSLPMLTRLLGRRAIPMRPLGLVLVPTRELAMQVSDGITPLAEAAGMRVRLVAGGMPYPKQIQAIERGVHVLVATPGRLMDLVRRNAVDLSEVAITVLDEADQMADMGFLPAVRELLDLTRPRGQRLLFSATLDGDVDTLVREYLHKPARHELAPVHAPVETMDHHILLVHPMDKESVAAQIGARQGRTIFFVRTQAGVDRLTDHLAAQGVAVGGLHGGKTQAVRTRTLNDFRDGTTPALVATDVAARGIHVDGISLVVHVDAPTGPKDYLHRAGRTARAGHAGTVVLLASPRQQRTATHLVNRAGVQPTVTRVRPGDEQLSEITGAREPSGTAWHRPASRDTGRATRPGAGSRSGSRSGNQAGGRPGSRSGSRPDARRGTHPGSRPDTRDAKRPDPANRAERRQARYGSDGPSRGERSDRHGDALTREPAGRTTRPDPGEDRAAKAGPTKANRGTSGTTRAESGKSGQRRSGQGRSGQGRSGQGNGAFGKQRRTDGQPGRRPRSRAGA